eukprot:gb/GFBE01076215.1/.p1 GENE.gb/GFBE01076215.1/~~gb/GFBE01076215.1/.p1  ORF type:complete len:361 (+),score=61.87 gb/GFBE01076215.1/:1-1083(+)
MRELTMSGQPDEGLVIQMRDTSRGVGRLISREYTKCSSQSRDDDSDASLGEESKGHHGLTPGEIWLGVLAVIWMAAGVVLAMSFMPPHKRNLVTAIYWVAQVATGVGYGDVIPIAATQEFKVFLGLFLMAGTLLVSLGITARLHHIMDHGKAQLKGSEHTTSQASRHNVLVSGGYLLTFLSLGTVYYGLIDTCTCEQEHGCDRMSWEHEIWSIPVNCESHRDLATAFYMSCVTLTTVGFGDETPKSLPGQLFGAFFMLLGVAAMANFMMEVAHLFSILVLEEKASAGIGEELFNRIDADGSGTLSKFEYVIYMLVEHGLVPSDDVELLLEQFEGFDVNNDGSLTMAEIKAQIEQRARDDD